MMCRNLVFFQTTWVTKCWKIIMGFLRSDTKGKLPSPTLIISNYKKLPLLQKKAFFWFGQLKFHQNNEIISALSITFGLCLNAHKHSEVWLTVKWTYSIKRKRPDFLHALSSPSLLPSDDRPWVSNDHDSHSKSTLLCTLHPWAFSWRKGNEEKLQSGPW